MHLYRILRKSLLTTVALFSVSLLFAQTSTFKSYSHTEFFRLLTSTKDSVFRLENAIIKYNPATDAIFSADSGNGTSTRIFSNTDSLIIDNEIILNNVHFDHLDSRQLRALHHIIFTKDVTLRNTASVIFTQCTFKGRLNIASGESMAEAIALLDRNSRLVTLSASVLNSKLENGIGIDMGTTDEKTRSQIRVMNSEIWSTNQNRGIRFGGIAISALTLWGNSFYKEGKINIITTQVDAVNISGNDFGDNITEIQILGTEDLNKSTIEENTFGKQVFLDFDQLNSSSTLEWSQWSNKVFSSSGFRDYYSTLPESSRNSRFISYEETKAALLAYETGLLIESSKSYKEEVKLRGKLLDLYKSQHDLEDVNIVYIEMKDLETKRLAYLYSQNPTFNTFFKWKVNQFLKSFSDYGTEPSKAITFSVNVVFLFALFYLFFPNSWDEEGKHRILERFNFFQKYLRSSAGAHEFYLEERRKKHIDYQKFKESMEEGRLELPKFFIAWSRPVYNAAMLRTQLSTKFLKSTDLLSGKWNELSSKQKRWKNIQIGTLLIIGIVYDLMIRILNSLMLSINAFTTLGFGEIPIKGLPRYLAIIQGFIGWFMLTIFSVSLISQLLN